MVWASGKSNQPHQNTLPFLNAHIHMFNHSPIQHSRRDIPPTAFLLQGIATLEDDTFSLGETISDVWQIITRVTVMHIGSTLIG